METSKHYGEYSLEMKEDLNDGGIILRKDELIKKFQEMSKDKRAGAYLDELDLRHTCNVALRLLYEVKEESDYDEDVKGLDDNWKNNELESLFQESLRVIMSFVETELERMEALKEHK